MKSLLYLSFVLLLCDVNVAFSSEKESNDFNAENPQDIIHFYCDSWKDGDYRLMYSALSETIKTKTDYDNFKKQRIRDLEKVGLPVRCVIDDNLMDINSKSLWLIRITFSNNLVGEVTTKNWCEKNGKFWTLAEGGLVSGLSSTPFY